jgi:hypothetical protein
MGISGDSLVNASRMQTHVTNRHFFPYTPIGYVIPSEVRDLILKYLCHRGISFFNTYVIKKQFQIKNLQISCNM